MVSLGKFRHMSQCSTAEGHFVILAIDHRANLREALSAARGMPVDDKEVGDFKRDVVTALGDLCSGVLGDPAFVLGYGIASGLLRGSQGLIAPVEVTNYALHPSDREVHFIPGWNVEKAKRVGLNGMKLLLYFHPDAPTAPQRIRLARMLADVCARYDIPLFIEPMLHPLKTRPTMTSAAPPYVEMCRPPGSIAAARSPHAAGHRRKDMPWTPMYWSSALVRPA